MMPGGCCPLEALDEDARRKIVEEIVEREAFYRQALTAQFQAMVKRWKLYYAERTDRRLPHEKKWRAFTVIPYPFSVTETKAASLCEIMNSSDPPIQAEGIGKEDEHPAKKMERIHAYMLQKNKWAYQQDLFFRDMIVQGTAVWKLVWENRVHQIRRHPTDDEVALFDTAVDAAVANGMPQPPEDPASFEEWRDVANKTLAPLGVFVPEMPTEQPAEIPEYRGPALSRPAMWDLRFDPMVEDWQEQDLVVQRIVKPKRWLLERTGDEPGKRFDPHAVEDGIAAGSEDQRFQTWEREVAAMLGISMGDEDPLYRDAVELFECWRMGARDDVPYAVILNRKAIINKNTSHPYYHGKLPYIAVRNVPQSRRALGVSDHQQTGALYEQMWRIYDLLLDAVVLAVIPVFTKRRGSGLPDSQYNIRPGGFLDVDATDAIQTLTKFQPGLEVALSMIADLKANVDESNATQQNVRGNVSTVGRVSATEHQARLNQALIRTKQQVRRIEDEHQEIPLQSNFLWYQFGDPKTILRIGGKDLAFNPFLEMTREEFYETLSTDFYFRGGTQALNRELTAQQLENILKTAISAQALDRSEVREWIRQILEVQGHKGVDTLLTAQADAVADVVDKTGEIGAGMQIKQVQDQAQMANLPPPPTEIPLPPEGAAAVAGAAGGAETLPEGA